MFWKKIKEREKRIQELQCIIEKYLNELPYAGYRSIFISPSMHLKQLTEKLVAEKLETKRKKEAERHVREALAKIENEKRLDSDFRNYREAFVTDIPNGSKDFAFDPTGTFPSYYGESGPPVVPEKTAREKFVDAIKSAHGVETALLSKDAIIKIYDEVSK